MVDRGTVSTCNSSASDGAFVSYDDGSHTKLGCLVAISCHPIRRMPACGRIRAQRDAAHCVCLRSDMAGASWEGPSHLSKITHTFCWQLLHEFNIMPAVDILICNLNWHALEDCGAGTWWVWEPVGLSSFFPPLPVMKSWETVTVRKVNRIWMRRKQNVQNPYSARRLLQSLISRQDIGHGLCPPVLLNGSYLTTWVAKGFSVWNYFVLWSLAVCPCWLCHSDFNMFFWGLVLIKINRIR